VHPALGNSEAQAIDAWWHKRAADLAFLTSPEAKGVIASEGVILLDYRPLQKVWAG
jgi:chitin disaccharide deacetylase